MTEWYVKARKAAKAQKVTYDDLAARTGFKRARIGHWMTGRRSANVEEMQAIAKALGVSPGQWVDDSYEGLSERGRAAGLVFDKMTSDDKRGYFPADHSTGEPANAPRQRRKGANRRSP